MSRPIHQWLAGASTGDAVTTYAQALREIFRAWGHPSELFADSRHVSSDMRAHCRDLGDFPDAPPPGSAVLYHFSVGSPLTARFLALPRGTARVVSYHNITPPQYLRALSPETTARLEEGRRQLALLAPQVDLGLGVSEYNRRELEEAGCRRSAVVPLIWDRPDLAQPADPEVLAACGGRTLNWLFVGRVVPNKKIEDLIRAFYSYRTFVHRHSRLFIVGSSTGMERYLFFLRGLAAQLELPEVIFTGHVKASQLVAYYRRAHVMVCMSEHEGFCMPLLEAMSFGVPVLAYAAAAVPETLGGGGILFSRKDYPVITELAHLAATDPAVREPLIEAGRKRLEDFSTAAVTEALRAALVPLLGAAAKG